MHHDVSGLGRLTHQVEDNLILRYLEVSVDLHTTLMCMCRHRVPYRTRLKLGHTHAELCGLENIRVDELVDYTSIGQLRLATWTMICLGHGDQLRLVAYVCRCGNHVELRRLLCII